ncbi:site-specific DNA-methyltransferase [Bacteroides graminisolvens]|uniref:site-specific DNA-methyltransferase n=1 Tax=Bacteroides graminisolvens TaxID=477666 RepID=UPI00240A2C76|nr:site-specific DNA-methyltransferase [Bacteroides graminisolvens]
MNSIDKLDLRTPDFVSANIEKLAALFPHCVTESADGKKIDFDLLQQELCNDIVEGNRERYRLEWPGKREAIVTANMPTTKTLRPVREDSVDFDNTENLYIEGDNLEVLKLLQESYFGKIKMIYIDPPYNTGNDFVYKDNFATDRETELFESGQIDECNRRMVANPETSGRYHSDWLTMMYPRLKLARNLLTDDGVIFISIDDNEVHNLRKICDEVFGEVNFVANVVWQKKYAATNDSKGFSATHDHIIIYQRSDEFNRNLLPRTVEQNVPYKNDDNDGKGLWRADNILVKSFSSNCVYPIVNPNTGVEFLPPEGSCWRANQDTMLKWLSENRIYFGKDGKGAPQLKRYLNEVQQGRVPITWWTFQEVGHNDAANKELTALFGAKTPFDTPKPSTLVRQILLIASKTDSIILDFFSGSATTAHAVMQLNAEDGGNRKYIMVQLPEQTDEKSEAYKAGYQNICEIGKERIRRAANKVKEEKRSKTEKEGLFANVEDTQDYGFRVYRLAESNMQDVYYRPQDYKQESMDMFADNIKPDRTADDLLAQVMLDWGLPLSYKIDQASINGKQVFRVAQDSLLACFDKGIDEAFAKEIAKEKPLRVVFRDSGFASDTAKINVQQLLKQLTPETEMKVI